LNSVLCRIQAFCFELDAMFGAAGRRTVNEEQNIPSQNLTRVSRKKHWH
jgi:hypothetical protein